MKEGETTLTVYLPAQVKADLREASIEVIIEEIRRKFNAMCLRLPDSQGTGLIPAEILMKIKHYFYELLILLL